MHPSEFKEYAEHLMDMYNALHEEVKRLRKENRSLHEELSRARDHPPEESIAQIRPLKMGADWRIDGDPLLGVSLVGRIRFPCPICNVRISNGGKVIFSLNRRIFLLSNGIFYGVEDTIFEFNPASIRNDLVENYRCVFEFWNEDIVVFYKDALRHFSQGKCVWEFPITGVYHLVIRDNMIYVGIVGGIISVFKDKKCVAKLDHGFPLRSFVVAGAEKTIVGFTEKEIVMVQGRDESSSPKKEKRLKASADITEQLRIRSLCASPDNVIYYGGEFAGVRVCQTSTGIFLRETIPLKKPTIAVGTWGEYLVVSSQDKSLYIMSLRDGRRMRISTPEDVVDFSANKDTLCCVDNGGSLRIWRLTSKC